MSHDFMHPKLHELRKRDLLRQARLHRLAREASAPGYAAAMPGRLRVLLGDVMIAGGMRLKGQHDLHSHPGHMPTETARPFVRIYYHRGKDR